MQSYRPFIVIAIVLAAAITGGVLLFKASRNNGPANPPPPRSSSFVPRCWGSCSLLSNVVVTLEEFGDYQCPPCGWLHPTLKQLKKELGPNLNFVFRNLPLQTIHKNAMVAAQAAEAARVQNRFWEMHDFLYENQDLWKDDINPSTIFVKAAGDLGLDTARFRQDMEDKQVQMRIAADADAATQKGVNGTPTIFIDGLELRSEMMNPEGIRRGIEQMIRRKLSQ
jgi:protein-disulfide isomerase